MQQTAMMTGAVPKKPADADHPEGMRTINIHDALCVAVVRSQLITDSLKVRYAALLHDFDRDGVLTVADCVLLFRNTLRGSAI